jgi:hypothetical protein
MRSYLKHHALTCMLAWMATVTAVAAVGVTVVYAQMLPPPAAANQPLEPAPQVQSSGDVQLMPRQMMVLREGLDAVYGQVMFVVRNHAAVPLPLKFTVLLPKETADFSPREGLEPSEVVLAEARGDGGGFKGLLVDKTFPPGVLMMTIGFKVDAQLGRTTMTLSHPDGIKDLNLLTLKDGRIQADSASLVTNERPEDADPLYKAFELKAPVNANETISIEISGVPEGRLRLWWLGGIFGGVLVFLVLILAWKTWPKMVADQTGETMIVG